MKKKNFKKIRDLIKKAISELSATGMGILHTQSTLEEALDELLKSDWIPVEDELPKCGEEVYVRAAGNRGIVYLKLSRNNLSEVSDIQKKFYDKNGFLMIKESTGYHVTHWKPIEKLEK